MPVRVRIVPCSRERQSPYVSGFFQNRQGQGMQIFGLHSSGETSEFRPLLITPFSGRIRVTAGIPQVMVPVLSKQNTDALATVLQVLPAFDQDTGLGRFSHGCHCCDGADQEKRTGTSHDEYGNGPVQIPGHQKV